MYIYLLFMIESLSLVVVATTFNKKSNFTEEICYISFFIVEISSPNTFPRTYISFYL